MTSDIDRTYVKSRGGRGKYSNVISEKRVTFHPKVWDLAQPGFSVIDSKAAIILNLEKTVLNSFLDAFLFAYIASKLFRQ